MAGYAFRIFNDETKENPHIIRNIRNAFAHAKKIIDFKHELVIAELAKIKVPKRGGEVLGQVRDFTKSAPQEIYVVLCQQVTTELIRTYLKLIHTDRRRLERKLAKYADNPLAQALFNQPESQPQQNAKTDDS